ncbi:Phosphate transport system permease protein PstA [Candidatus Methylobacter favarea]|uniref:Phosphate transport system permease protein PstA n=1 Tax=Candidatus Methylobacter favarea TaxID=2707345 RepID=A0A8S0XI84_9GAMM|nr:phosphate ABC transporter permease PstA [Candidatus Methylobacter favarea]CAA9890456.1 Phosphate transport system permease protein PstA [Candidatus Methylobacter favarea]
MNRNSRYAANYLFTAVVWSAVIICCALLCFLLSTIIWNGVYALSFKFLLSPASGFGANGGIIYQITGSILLIAVTAIISLPIALGVAIYKSEFLKSCRLQRLSNLLIYGLNGVPSVIFGIFGLIFFVNLLGAGISWFAGAIILAIMILPTIVLSTYQAINSIPTIYRESAQALGLDTWQIITRVLLPQGLDGAITGLLIGLARAIGETAPIMFVATAFSGVDIPDSLNGPITTLPTHILALAKQATDAQALQNAWGAGLVLLCLVMLLGFAALMGRIRLKTRWQ